MDLTGSAPSTQRRRLLILAGLWLFLLVLAVAFRGVLMPFAGAALIAYLIAPAVERLSRVEVRGKRVPRWAAVLLIYTLFFLGVYLFFVALVPNIYAELVRISGDAVAFARSLTPDRIEQMAQAAEEWLRVRGVPAALSKRSLRAPLPPESGLLAVDLNVALKGMLDRGAELLEENVGDIVTVTRGVVTALATGVFMLFFVLMVAAFLSIDARAVRRYAASLVPPELMPDMRVLVAAIDRSLAGVVRGQVTICLVNGALTFVGLVLFQVKFAFLLATIATFFSLIPIFGTIISSVPIVLIGLSQGFGTGVAILLWIIGIHALEAYFLNPKILGSAARIHPVVVAFALIAGERQYGLLGALFAVPVAAILVACFDFLRVKAQGPAAVAMAPDTPAAQAVLPPSPPAA